jgi:hypothetical protein
LHSFSPEEVFFFRAEENEPKEGPVPKGIETKSKNAFLLPGIPGSDQGAFSKGL